MARSVVMLMLLAAPLGCAQTGYQSSDRLKPETERNVVSLSAKLKEVNQPTALDAELEAQCKVNCSDSKLQTQMAGLNAERLRASNELVAQIHQSVDAYMVRNSKRACRRDQPPPSGTRLETDSGRNGSRRACCISTGIAAWPYIGRVLRDWCRNSNDQLYHPTCL
jgi:hypothetical protein